MKLGLIIYGSLDTLSGGYLYDRRLVEYLRLQGDTVEIISLPWRSYAAHLSDNLHVRLPSGFDALIQDELNHPSLVRANRGVHPYPVISLVHHLRSSERRPAWQNAFYRLVEEKYLRLVDGFIFNSQTTAKVVRALTESKKPGIVAYPPTDRFGAPLPEEAIVDRARNALLRILFVGNVIYRKGLHTLLEALAATPSLFQVDVVGSLTSQPAYTRQIEEQIKRCGLSPYVSLHGPLDQEPLVERLRRAHVLVVPSSYEGFGIVYLEGMCFGLPAIGTTAGAAAEVIEHGRTGYLVAPEDPESLAAHLLDLATDRDLLTRLSLGARSRYLEQPAWEATARRIRGFLETMVKQFNGLTEA